jgi:hypothetical protein
MIAEHVLLGRAGSIPEAHERLSQRVTNDLLETVVALVPIDWLEHTDGAETYVEYLSARLHDASFAEEAERARARP